MFYSLLTLTFVLYKVLSVDCSGGRRLLREKQELKAPQERSDEEIEALPAESVRLE